MTPPDQSDGCPLPEPTPDEPADVPASPGLKEGLWIASLVVGLLLICLPVVREHLFHADRLSDDIRMLGPAGPLVFVGVAAVLILIGFPRLPLGTVAGLVFGFTFGLLLSLTASILGSFGTFLYARWAGKELVLRRWPRLEGLTSRIPDRSFLTVALIRQVPQPGFLSNLLLGISSVHPGAFLAGTLIGFIPGAVPAVLLGSSVLQPAPGMRVWTAGIAGACIVVLWVVSALLARRFRSAGLRLADEATKP